MATNYDRYVERMRKIADIGHSIAVLNWDKETYLPKKSANMRSQQIATLSGIVHEEFTNPKFGNLLKRLNKQRNLDDDKKKNVTVTLNDYHKATKFTKRFVMQKSMAVSKCFQAWLQAREANDFRLYQKSLEELVKIKRIEAKKLGSAAEHLYDNLLDQYEPGLTVAKSDKIFNGMKKPLKKLINKINKKKAPKKNFLYKKYNKDAQWNLGIYILNEIGYDFDHGRQDISTHPFTTSFSSNDVRITTRIDEKDLSNMLWSCIHEGGHALYEQGLPIKNYGLPTGSAISLSIHESQSRIWENNVARGKAFWNKHFRTAKNMFPKQLKNQTVDSFYKAINVIEPNLIRTEADELHYHYHVLIRYEIEKALIEGSIEVADLRDVWNAKYKEYLNIDVTDDVNGVLQDIHWSHGSFGYFPTYSLGSFYAAQLYAQAEKEIPKLEKQIAAGNSLVLLDWLREKVHRHGRRYEAEELCEMITGEPLNIKYFMDYAKKKYQKVYT